MFWTLSIALLTCVLLHLVAIAVTGLAFGVRVRTFVVGLGPTLLRGRNVQVRLLPVGGAVAFETSDHAFDAQRDVEPARCLDLQPRHRQMLISLSGCVALLLLAAAVLQSRAVPELGRGFVQIAGGALSPLGTAQELLRGAHERLRDLPLLAVLGWVAVKLAALNLLPCAPFNAASAIGAALQGGPLEAAWNERCVPAELWIALAMGTSWLVALVAYGIG